MSRQFFKTSSGLLPVNAPTEAPERQKTDIFGDFGPLTWEALESAGARRLAQCRR